jgi:hypothetical protein
VAVAMGFSLPGEPEQLLELFFTVSIPTPGDVRTVHNYEHYIIPDRALLLRPVTMIIEVRRLETHPLISLVPMGRDISAEGPAQLIG